MDYPNKIIEELLPTFALVIGKDYCRYKNHIYRVFLNCLLMDDDKMNEEKYAIAAVFHDIGIWTGSTFDYLSPSGEQAGNYLLQKGKRCLTGEITAMIYWHHKISQYHGEHEKTVETFRKADWIDVTFGLIHFGVDIQKTKEAGKAFPTLGFHRFLVRAALKNFLGHPLKPLPMFKR
ncbi:MAG: hypothetical protein JWP81_2355 [Ferruginibacter sp.]|nr:hypothetical protein [Ferruginibacter sp.]